MAWGTYKALFLLLIVNGKLLMEFVPFGQDGLPPAAGKATKCRMSYNL
jgi:hypothetical protein